MTMDKQRQDQNFGSGQQQSGNPNRTNDQNKDQHADRNQDRSDGSKDQGQSAAGRPNQHPRDTGNR